MDEIEIVAYDPRWPALFAAEGARLRATLDPALVLAIEHLGSTAVPGLAAKPVIDIFITTPSIAAAQALIAPLEALGYLFWSDNPRKDRMFFVKGLPSHGARRTHHIHVMEATAELAGHRRFRDHLRAHPEEAERYAALMRSLAERHRGDREAYTEAKKAFIEAIVAKS